MGLKIVNEIECRLSGGANNIDPSQSLGGAMSSTRVGSQTITGSMAGVSILYVWGNSAGSHDLVFSLDNNTLSFAGGTPVDVSADGVFGLESGTSGGLVVSISTANLPSTNTTASLDIACNKNETFPDLSVDDVLYGNTQYACFYWTNTDAQQHIVTFWIDQQPNADDELDIGLDSAGVGALAATVVDNETAPDSVNFSRPTDKASGLTVTLQAGESVAWWQRRAISGGERAAVANDASQIGYAIL